jgi:GDSL-like lipase/acylhydrolase family protein
MRDTSQDSAVPGFRPVLMIGLLGTAMGVALMPPVFSAAFAMGSLLDSERAALWVFSILVAGVSSILVVRKSRPAGSAAALLFGVLLVIGVELAARLVVHVALPREGREYLAWLANRTYPEYMIIKGHPFLHYTASQNANNLGFLSSRDYVREKASGTIRIACLGGSTTAGKWPVPLEALLNEQGGSEGRRFEVLDFGQNGYSSAHTVVNFFLNVVEYDPDYVVLHEGWNDVVMRGKGEIKSDYSDVFRPFEYPQIPDRWFLRTSILYRYAEHLLYDLPAWANIRNALDIVGDEPVTFDNLDELRPYRRNIEKILDFARARGIKVVLTTFPHSTSSSVPNFIEAKHLDQCNVIVKQIHQERADTLFVDLDTEMTGKFDEHFRDLGHLDPVGDGVKARAIGEVILADVNGPK